jgi:hypothetical protein
VPNPELIESITKPEVASELISSALSSLFVICPASGRNSLDDNTLPSLAYNTMRRELKVS